MVFTFDSVWSSFFLKANSQTLHKVIFTKFLKLDPDPRWECSRIRKKLLRIHSPDPLMWPSAMCRTGSGLICFELKNPDHCIKMHVRFFSAGTPGEPRAARRRSKNSAAPARVAGPLPQRSQVSRFSLKSGLLIWQLCCTVFGVALPFLVGLGCISDPFVFCTDWQTDPASFTLPNQ